MASEQPDGAVSTGNQFAAPRPSRRPRAKRSGFHRQPGARTMKEYPLTSQELWQLAGLGLVATILFGMGSFFLSTWFDVFKDLSAPPDEMTQEMRGYWRGLMTAAGWATALCYTFGVVAALIGGLSVRHIMKCTEHPPE